MASGWKRAAEIVLARSGLPQLARRRNRPATGVLAYHNIVPTGEPLAGEASLHVNQRTFANQLDLILEHYDVVSLEHLADGASQAKNRVVITFDDAYLGAMTAGLEELRKRKLPATVFVPPGLLGAPGFWWDRLAPRGGGALPEGVRNYCLQTLQGRDDRILAWAAERRLEIHELPEHARPVDGETLVEKVTSQTVSLGSHTWSHPNLAALSDAAAEQELQQSKSWLEAESAAYVDWLAYPYGLHDDAVVRCAERHFEGGVLIRGGLAGRCGRWASHPHTVPRINIPRRLTLEGLALRLAGVLA